MKWKAFQRDELADAQLTFDVRDSPQTLAAGGLPQATTFASAPHSSDPLATASDPLNTEFADSYALGSSLLISKDIEALLKEDEKNRGPSGKVADFSSSADSSMDYPTYEDSGVPIIGLPAPPRGPRRTAPRERRQPSNLRADGSFAHSLEQLPAALQNTEKRRSINTGQDNDDTLISLSAFGPSNALHAPAIGDLAIDNSSPLEVEVMNALSSKHSIGKPGSFGAVGVFSGQRSVFGEVVARRDLAIDSSVLREGNDLSSSISVNETTKSYRALSHVQGTLHLLFENCIC